MTVYLVVTDIDSLLPYVFGDESIAEAFVKDWVATRPNIQAWVQATEIRTEPRLTDEERRWLTNFD